MPNKCKHCGADLGVMAGIVDHCVVHDYEEWLDIRPRDCYERELTQKNEAITALTAALLEEQAEPRKLREALEKAEDLTDWQEAELRKWRDVWLTLWDLVPPDIRTMMDNLDGGLLTPRRT